VEFKDYYRILGVPKKATDKEIRDAYRRLARKFHPDVNPGDKRAEEKFKEIGEAYAVLADADKRRKYDQLGPNWEQFARGSAGRTAGSPFVRTQRGPAAGNGRAEVENLGDVGLGGLGGFSDFFEMLFGQGAAGRGARPGPTAREGAAAAEQPVDVTLAEAFTGVQRIFEIQGVEACPVCGGSGQGSTGRACANCRGSGRQPRTRRIEAKIPAGVDTGSRITYRGGGGQGDLVLVVNVLPDPVFRREGSDLHCEVAVDLSVAVLGGEVAVQTPKGKGLLLKIPPESANGQPFVLRGQGMPRIHQDSRGDLYAKLSVVLPRHLTARERELFAELALSRSAATAAAR